MRWFAALLLIILLTGDAEAQMLCGQNQATYDQLRKDHHEERRALGKINSVLLELWVSRKGTFTILITQGTNVCFLASGTDIILMSKDKWEKLLDKHESL